MTSLESHIEIAQAHYVSVLLLCMCGMLLNVVMLVIFCTRKKVRGSVYTTYMIQIAITDLFICVVWLVMTAMYLDGLPSTSDVKQTYDVGKEKEDTAESVQASTKLESKNFSVYRFTYAVYNFHYYNNIFLLAAMSIERFVAVWKSLRCQKYQFNRKFIYAVSFVMWMLALACALPSFIDPNLITQNEEREVLLRKENGSQRDELAGNSVSSTLLSCYKPLQHAIKYDLPLVTDYDGVSAEDCMIIMIDYSEQYNSSLESILETEQSHQAFLDMEPEDVFTDEERDLVSNNTVNYTDESNYESATYGGGEGFDRLFYHTLLKVSLRVANILAKSGDIDDLCNPRLSVGAKSYQIVANLTIGFFIPFTAIMVTNLGIAFMIGNRARHRLVSGSGHDSHADAAQTGGRLSAFFKQFNHPSTSRLEMESGSYRKISPVVRRKAKQQRNLLLEAGQGQNSAADRIADECNKKRPQVAVTQRSVKPTVLPERIEAAKQQQRPHFSSFSMMQHNHRTSRGSASSAESFPTDLTSLHTSSSPGVRLSVPLFHHHDGKILIQRASSADSNSSGGSGIHAVTAKRWSSEVFRSSTTTEDRQQTPYEHGYKDPTQENSQAQVNSSSPTPRGEHVEFESTQEPLLQRGSHDRIYIPKSKTCLRQHSAQSNGRSRICSSASSSKGGTTRKTMVYKNAERQMRVSITVLAYAVVFAICWLPQRIVTIFYVTEGFIGKTGHFCHVVTSTTRTVSFFSVLLNPIVYAVTQRELRRYIRQTINKLCKCICPTICFKTKANATPCGCNGNGISDKNISGVILNNPTTDEVSRQDRHARNRERWSRVVQRLGRKNVPWSVSASGGMVSQAGKPSDGTIDEEKEEDNRNPSSKGQSSSNSFKLTNRISGWEDWKELLTMVGANGEQSKLLKRETIL